MNQMDGMGRIESAQTELCQFLMSMIPVEWTKICFYGDVTNAGRSTSAWISLVEKKTGLICTQGAFWRRYEKYSYKTAYAMDKLCDLVDALWNAYVERFGVEKTWCAYYLTINEDYTFHVDLGYELLGDDKTSRTDAVFEKFYYRKYTDCWYEYPFNNIQGASLSIFRYLIKVIPVEWSRICFMDEVKYGSGEISTWMAWKKRRQEQSARRNLFGRDTHPILSRKRKSTSSYPSSPGIFTRCTLMNPGKTGSCAPIFSRSHRTSMSSSPAAAWSF